MRTQNRWTIALVSGILATLAAAGASAQSFKTLVNFNDNPNGAEPTAALVQGLDGNLYGTTTQGGSTAARGTVFKMTPTGALTTLLSFCAPDGCKLTGDAPPAGLVQATDRNFYGTALDGIYSDGVVFKITSTGSESILYYFCAQTNCTDGALPMAGLVQGTDGEFYGSTQSGGSVVNNDFCPEGQAKGCGTVYKIDSTGALTTLYNFCSQTDCTDGVKPVGGLVQGTDGNFYGTTSRGGNVSSCGSGCGTVYKITPSGALTTLHTFEATDGAYPLSGVIQGADGNFYGTTSSGGPINNCGFDNGCGTIFKITPGGTFTTLYSFCVQIGCLDGDQPVAGLIQATDGNFYGTTKYGGSSSACSSIGGCGTVFRITPSGVLTTPHSFDATDGESPSASLVQDTSGAFYGTTWGGGTPSCIYEDGCGTIFSLNLGLGPFAETLPAAGKVGATVQILGTALTGATSVTFNGTAASFKVISASEIGATVPAGATTGTVQVKTPSKTLSSNVPFRVIP